MARWVSVDVRQLKALQKRLDRLQKVDFDQFAETTVKELAARMLRKVKERTHVVTGALHDNWKVMSVVKIGDIYEIEVFNAIEYAAYVEYGHRTANHKGWVPGRYMMTISARELQRDAPRIIEKKLTHLLTKELDGK